MMFDLQGKNLYLIGLMGSGKSTLGKLLAERLEYEFIDIDTKILEQAQGKSILEIFETDGEDTFRSDETAALKEVANRRLVVATGGGIVTKSENLKCLAQGLTIWIDPTLDILLKRLKRDEPDNRPLLARLPQLYIDRRDLYDKAQNIHIPITSSYQSPLKIVEEIMKQITN